MARTIISEPMKLTREDVGRIVKNALIFSSPALIAFLVALQGGMDIEYALGAAYSALLGIVIDTLRKLTGVTQYKRVEK